MCPVSRKSRKGSHTVSRLTCHIVWATKYRYKVLRGDIQIRCRELHTQVCEAEDIEILKGVISSDHVHMHIEYAPKENVSSIVKLLKGRSSRKLQLEYPKLKERYWGRHFWASGYGVWSSGNITDKMVDDYLEHHRRKDDSDENNFILE